MSTDLFVLIALWCAPLGVVRNSGLVAASAPLNYSRVQACRIRIRNCLNKGQQFNYSGKLEGCLYDSHVEEDGK